MIYSKLKNQVQKLTILIVLLISSNKVYSQVKIQSIEKDNKLFVCDGDFMFTLNGYKFFTFCVNEPELGRQLKPGDTLWCVDVKSMKKWAEDINYTKRLEAEYDKLFAKYNYTSKALDSSINIGKEVIKEYDKLRSNCLELTDMYKKLDNEHDISLKMLRETKDELNKTKEMYEKERKRKKTWRSVSILFIISSSILMYSLTTH
jgi:hypothetical protein